MTAQITNSNTTAIDSTQTKRSTDAIGNMQGLLGGAMIQEYDAQIQDFTADMSATNAEKSAVRADKTQISTLQTNLSASSKQYSATDKFYTTDTGEHVEFTEKGSKLTSAQYKQIKALCEKYGVDPDKIATDGKNYVLPDSLAETLKGQMDSKLTDLNSTSEMKMVNYQALMDARKQSMMLLSNMLNSDTQTKMAIIQNMKN